MAGSHFKEDEARDLGGGASATLAHLDTLSPQMLQAKTRPSRKVGTRREKKKPPHPGCNLKPKEENKSALLWLHFCWNYTVALALKRRT